MASRGETQLDVIWQVVENHKQSDKSYGPFVFPMRSFSPELWLFFNRKKLKNTFLECYIMGIFGPTGIPHRI